MSQDEAEKLVLREFEKHVAPGTELAVVPYILRKRYGWVMHLQSRQFLETREFRHMLIGLGTIIVLNSDSSVHIGGSAQSSEEYIAEFELERGLPSGDEEVIAADYLDLPVIMPSEPGPLSRRREQLARRKGKS